MCDDAGGDAPGERNEIDANGVRASGEVVGYSFSGVDSGAPSGEDFTSVAGREGFEELGA